MTKPAAVPLRPDQLFVVAFEYAGSDVPARLGGARRPLLEHAYEIKTGTMPAHLNHPPRIAFPDPRRGWPTTPQVIRCASCTLAVTDLIRDVVVDLLEATRLRLAGWFTEPAAELLLFPPISI